MISRIKKDWPALAESLLYALFRWLRHLFSDRVRRLLLVYKSADGTTLKGVYMSIVVRNDQQVAFSLQFEDAYGNPVTELGSTPEWAVSSDELATIELVEGGKAGAVIKPTGKLGTVIVTVKVDADPGAGVEELLGQAEIQILSGKARKITLNGTISDKTEAPSQPEQPEQPAPSQPEQPKEPEQPEQPKEPEQPAPSQPEQPSNPKQPGAGGKYPG